MKTFYRVLIWICRLLALVVLVNFLALVGVTWFLEKTRPHSTGTGLLLGGLSHLLVLLTTTLLACIGSAVTVRRVFRAAFMNH